MEHVTMPFSKDVIASDLVRGNLDFIEGLAKESMSHPYYRNALFENFKNDVYTKEFVVLFVAQYSKHIRVFTKVLANLLGAVNDLETRYVLFDNFYEEMGMGVFEEAHYNLFLSMLASMGVSKADIARLPNLYSMEVLNDALFNASNDVVAGLAWLGIGGEQTIPHHFPYVGQAIERHFNRDELDLRFFGRHGQRDAMHADDATLALAVNMTAKDREKVRLEAYKSLHTRNANCEEFLRIANSNPEKYLK